MLFLQLRTFKQVVESGSFSKAAKVLHMTQSAVSQHVLFLEQHFGVKLFNRLYRALSLTPAGEKLYPYAVRSQNLLNLMEKELQQVTGQVGGKLTLGASYTIGEYVLPKLLAQYRMKHRQLDLQLDIFNTDQIIAMTLAGKLDLGFIEGLQELPAGLTCCECGSDQLVVLAGPNRKPVKTPVDLADLLEETWVLREKLSGTRNYFEDFLEQCGLQPPVDIVEFGSSQAIKEAVKAGLGLTALSEFTVQNELARQELQVVRLTASPITRTFHVVWHKEKALPFSAELFLDQLNLKYP